MKPALRAVEALVWALILSLLLPWVAYAQPPAQGTAVAQTAGNAPDLDIPQPTIQGSMACFTQDGYRQLLRIGEYAHYQVHLSTLHAELEQRMQELIAELQGAQREYVAMRQVIEERNVALREDLASARAEAERYQARAERRRIWPWVTLGFGVIGGALLGAKLAH